jgi:iduronate 2-sulfatase
MHRALLLLLPLAACGGNDRSEHTNVLLICVDDLRPDLGCMDLARARTPNLDALADQGRLFTQHYVSVPTCGASRLAMLTGRHPVDPRSFGNGAFELLAADDEPEQPESFVHLFRRAGYRTVSIGKITHSPDGRVEGEPELPYSWDEVGAPHGQWPDSWDAFFGYADHTGRAKGESPPYELLEGTEDTSYPDGLIAAAAERELAQLAERDAPFLLAVGFYKPHLPWCVPEPYWDMHPIESVDLPPNPHAPQDSDRDLTLHASGELLVNYGGYQGDPRVDQDYARHLRRAYRAAVSYVDAQVGRVLDALDRAGLEDSTVVVLWSDHGWHLGDHGVWGKHTLHERSLRSPLIVRAPGFTAPGVACGAIVESVDLFPTLTELCGLELPGELDGTSLVPQLEDPASPSDGRASSWWRRAGRAKGHSLRTDRWRLTRWRRAGEQILVELYDQEADPEESVNVAAGRPEVVEELSNP